MDVFTLSLNATAESFGVPAYACDLPSHFKPCDALSIDPIWYDDDTCDVQLEYRKRAALDPVTGASRD